MIPRDTKLPYAYEVMNKVLDRGDAQELARRFVKSAQLVRSWCRAPETDEEIQTGKFGPLDRLRTIITLVKEDDGGADRAYPIGQYIASLLGGVFVPMPTRKKELDDELMARVSKVLKENGEAIEATRKAWYDETPGKISKKEGAVCAAEINEAIVSLVQLRDLVEHKAKSTLR